jgi:hypothetical protein
MAEALATEFAPLGAPQIDARIAHLVPAGAAETHRLVFPEFDAGVAIRATDIEDVLRFPIPHILSRAIRH